MHFARPSPVGLALKCAVATAVTFVGGMTLGVAIGNVVFEALPDHLDESLRTAVSAMAPVTGLVAGSAGWGIWMGRLADREKARRVAWAGVLGLTPTTLALGAGLIVLESVAAAGVGARLTPHRVFTILFVPTAFLIGAAGGLALGYGLRDRALARKLAWRAGLAAAVAFLIVTLVMDSLGWRVGAPGAAERYTMVTVTFAGAVGAALAGGAVIGLSLARVSQLVRHTA